MEISYKILSLLMVACFINACQTAPSKPVDMSKALNAEAVKTLFTNKTVDGYNEVKHGSYQVFFNHDGTMVHKNAKRIKTVSWDVKSDGQHCAIFPKKTICGFIVPAGNGVYHKIVNGTHTLTLKNFVEGNQISMM